MKQVVENMKNGEVRLVETPAPCCGRDELLVRNRASLISPGTEKLLIEMGRKSLAGKAIARTDLMRAAYEKAKREGFLAVFREALARLDQPVPLGYSSSGDVLEVGGGVSGFSAGDAVACAGYGFASHAEIVAVPSRLCVRLGGAGRSPAPYEEASFVMLGGIALQGIRSTEATFGETVAVVGLGVIGLLTVKLLKAYGCRPVGIDVDPEKILMARAAGCGSSYRIGEDDVEAAVAGLTSGHGADAVIVAAASTGSEPLLLAEKIARRRGKIVLVGMSDVALTRKSFWDKELSFSVSKAAGPASEDDPRSSAAPIELFRWTEERNLGEFVRLLESGALDVRDLITHRFPVSGAESAYDMILEGRERYAGVVITYPPDSQPGRTVPPGPAAPRGGAPRREGVGVVGAGMFARNFLIPALAKAAGAELVGIASRTGASSAHAASKFGFRYAASEYRTLLDDSRIGSVVIATRHDLHGRLAAEALEAGKHVFVEKPLCIRPEELEPLIRARRSGGGKRMFMVGFNRRYAPLSVLLRKEFARRNSPMEILYRVNAGYIPPGHWTHDPAVGGGRIVGEVCHMVDFIRFLTGAKPIEVTARSISGSGGKFGPGDNVSLVIGCSDGSVGTILYTAMGPKSFPRERVEVFCDGAAAALTDFRTLECSGGARRLRKKLWSAGMGYHEEMAAFIAGDPAEAEENFLSAVDTTKATFSALESLRTGLPQKVS